MKCLIYTNFENFIYFFNSKYNNSRLNAYTQVFIELCTLRPDHPKLDLLCHMKTFSFKWLFVVVFS